MRTFRGSLWTGLLGVALASGCVIVDDPDTGDDGADSGSADEDDDGNDDQVSADEGTDDGSPPPPEPLVPDNDYCMDVGGWSLADSMFEDQVLELVNIERSMGATCGNQSFGAAGPLVMDPALRCAARVHSLDMAVRDFFDHDNPDGEDPFVRMEQAGYQYLSAGENIAAGQTSPEEVVQGWMESPGHCSNIMDPFFTELGVGYYHSTTAAFPHYWTQCFGTPG